VGQWVSPKRKASRSGRGLFRELQGRSALLYSTKILPDFQKKVNRGFFRKIFLWSNANKPGEVPVPVFGDGRFVVRKGVFGVRRSQFIRGVQLDGLTLRLVDELARQRGKSRSQLIRDLIRKEAASNAQQALPGFGDGDERNGFATV